LQVAQWQLPDFSTLDYCVEKLTKETVYSCTLEHEKHSSAVLNVAEHITISGSSNNQGLLFTTKGQGVLQPAVAIFKNLFSAQVTVN